MIHTILPPPLSISKLEYGHVLSTMNDAQRANLRIDTIFAHILGLLPQNNDSVRFGPFEKMEEKHDLETKIFMQVYTRQVHVGSGFLQQSRVAIIGLLFRENTYGGTGEHELYALTSHNDWQAFSSLIDQQFSERVHCRIVEPEVQRVVYQDLVGNGLYTDKTFKKPKKLEPDRFFDKFLIEITSSIKPNATIFSLKSFHEERNCQVTVKREALRFTVPVPFTEYVGLVDCLSKIHHENTFEEKNNSTYTLQKYLKPVRDTEARLLDDHMHTVLWNAFQHGSCHGLFLCHKFEDSYIQATRFSLIYQGRLIHTCKSPLTASNILQELRNHFPTIDKQEAFIELLSQITFAYTALSGAEVRSGLIKLFGGEIHLEDAAYFFVHGSWQSLTLDYVAFIHWQFRELMRECLLDADDVRTLKHPWEGNETEDSYNSAYGREQDMLIGDKVLAENNVELFDVLQMTKSGNVQEMVWHCVKAGFQQQMRDLASQVRVSASVAHALASSSQAMPLWFDQFCHELNVRNQNSGGINKIGGKEAIISAIARRQLTFVCDVYDTANRNILSDCFKQNAIEEGDLGAIKGQSVRNKLIEIEYLTANGHPTPKLRSVTQDRFKEIVSTAISCTKSAASDIHARIKKLTMPSFGSLIAPLELVKLRRQVTKKGFQFKIHFIPRADDPRGQEYKYNTFIAQFVKSLTLDTILQAGSQLTFRQQDFVLYQALDDGASAFHAAFGKLEEGIFFYPGGEKVARATFAKALSAYINRRPNHPQVLQQYTEQIRDLLIGASSKWAHGRVFALKLGQNAEMSIKQAYGLEEARTSKMQQLIGHFATYYCWMRDNHHPRFDELFTLLEPNIADHGIKKILFNMDTKYVTTAFNKHFARSVEFFNHPSFNIAQQNIALYSQEVARIDEQMLNFVTSKGMLDAYLAYINDRDFGFLPQEVCLAAQALSSGVRIIQKNIDGTITLMQEVGVELNTCPVLLYQNGNYFRCLPKHNVIGVVEYIVH